MEGYVDMDMSHLFCCELKIDKDYHYRWIMMKSYEHHLSLRTVRLGAGAKDELHVVEAEAVNYEGSLMKVILTTLKMSVQPLFPWGFEVTPSLVSWLKYGSGTVHINGQHLVAVEEDAESEDEEEKNVKFLNIAIKSSDPRGGSKFPQRKVKFAADEDDDDDENDNDDFEVEKTEEKTPRSKGQESFKKKKKKKQEKT
ncbi:nucleophosmin-like [Eulemur rufifrons]|uniref:nucleophosmin-like n=1 Tax=Eulemur rufifrons TaxID=859984 RepID=UPI00374377C3